MINEIINLSMKALIFEEAINLIKKNIKMLKGISEKLKELPVSPEFFKWQAKGSIYKNIAFDLIKAIKNKYAKAEFAELEEMHKLLNELEEIARGI